MRKQIKHGLLILGTVLSLLILVGCLKTFTLELPDNVTASIGEINSVKARTEIILTVDVPEDHEIDKFLVNGQPVVVTNNTYKFVLNSNTVVTVTFIALEVDFYNLTLPDYIISNQKDNSNIRSGSEVILVLDIPEDKRLDNLYINGVEHFYNNNIIKYIITKDTVVTGNLVDRDSIKYYSLTLPEHVTANVADITKIAANTEVILTFDIPKNKKLSSFKINNIPVSLAEIKNNTFSNNIQFDVVVTIELIDTNNEEITEGWYIPKKEDVVYLYNNFNPALFREGIMEFSVSSKSSSYLDYTNIIVDLNDKLNITNGNLLLNSFRGDMLINEQSMYTDGTNIYSSDIGYNYDGTIRYDNKENYTINLESQMVELLARILLFGGEDAISKMMPSGPHSFNDAFTGLFKYLTIVLPDGGDVIDSLDIMRKDDLYRVKMSLDKADIIRLGKDFFRMTESDFSHIDEQISIDIELNIVDNQLVKLTITNENNVELNNIDLITITLEYNNNVVIEPNDLSIYGPLEKELLNYHFHLDENDTTKLTISKKLMDDSVGFSDSIIDDIIEVTNFYKKGYKMVGFYLDNNFTNKLSGDDLLKDNLNIYVKWEKIKTAEQLLNEFIVANFISITDINQDFSYYEDDNYIIITKQRDTTYRILDKVNKKQYEGYSNGDIHFTYEIINTGFTIESLKQDFSNYNLTDVITINNVFYNFKNEITMFDNKILLNNANKYGLRNSIFEVLDEGIIDVNNYASLRLANVMEDKVVNIELRTYFDLIDINNFEKELTFTIIYASGLSETVGLSFLRDKQLVTYEMPKDTTVDELTLYYGDDELTINVYYYDSNKGTVIKVDGDNDYYYLKNMGMLPEYEIELYNMQFDGYRLDGSHDIKIFQELQLYANGKRVVYLTPNFKKKNFEDIVERFTANNIVTIEDDNYGTTLYYNVAQNLFIYKNHNNNKTMIELTEKYITLYNNESYLKITIEQYMQDRAIISRLISNTNIYFDITELKLVMDVIKGNISVLSETDNSYELDNGITFQIENDQIRLLFDTNSVYGLSNTVAEITTMKTPSYIYNIKYNSEFFSESFRYASNYSYYIADFDFLIEGKINMGFHLYNNDGTPNLDVTINQNDIQGSTNLTEIYVNYKDIPSVSAVIDKFTISTKYTIKSMYGNNTEMRILKDNRIEIYYYDELTNIIDIANNKSYYVSENILYELNNNEVFNFIDFINSFEENDFRYDSNYKGYTAYSDLNNKYNEMRISVIHDIFYLRHQSKGFSFNDDMIYVVADFDFIDISNYEIRTNDPIKELALSNNYRIVSVNNLDRLQFEIHYESGRTANYTYQEIREEYLVAVFFDYDNSYLELSKDGIINKLKFSEHNIKVYDETIDVIIMTEYEEEFYYLSDLTTLPQGKDNGNSKFVGWWDQYGNVVSIEDIRYNYNIGQIAYLYEIRDEHTIHSAFNYYINANRNIVFSINQYYKIVYDIESDAYIVYDSYNYYNYMSTIAFKGDNVIYSSEKGTFELPIRDIMIKSNSNLINSLSNYRENFTEVIDYLSKVNQVIKGEILIPNNEDNQMALNNGLLVTKQYSDISFIYNSIQSSIYLGNDESALNYNYNYLYNVTINNGTTNEDTIIGVNNVEMLINFELGYLGYTFIEYLDREDKQFNLVELNVGNTNLVAKYMEISEITTYFNKIKNNEQYILISEGIEYRIIKGKQIEVYIDGELKYVKLFDVGNNLTYELYENKYYVTDLNDEVFDFITFFELLMMNDFILSERNLYEHIDNNEFVTFLVDPQRNGYHIVSPQFEGHIFFEFGGTEFVLTDISNIIIEDSIRSVSIHSYNNYLSRNDLYENIYYEVNFFSGRTKHYTIYKFNEVYNATYEFRLDGSFVTYVIDGITKTVSFVSFGIDVFDYSLSSVIYFEKLNSYQYLANITNLPKLEETISSEFIGWYDGRYDAIVNLNFLKESINEGTLIYLKPQYSTKSSTEIFNSFRENGTVNFTINSASFKTQYNFATDTFINIKDGQIVSTVKIDSNNVTITSQIGTLTLTIEQFRLNNNYSYLSELLDIEYNHYYMSSMLKFRDVILGNEEIKDASQTSVDFTNMVIMYTNIESIVMYDRHGYEWYVSLTEKTILEFPQYSYLYEVLIKNDINKEEILVNTNTPYIIENNKFNYEEYVFNSYYFADDIGGIDYNANAYFYSLDINKLNVIYASYDNLIYPEEFLLDYINSEKYVATSYNYLFNIYQNNQIDVYKDGIIKYVVLYANNKVTKYELIDNLWFVLLDDTLEFDFTNIFKKLNNNDFILRNTSEFYQKVTTNEGYFDISVYTHNDSFYIYHEESNIFDNSYQLEIKEFELYDIGKIQVTEDVIINISMDKIMLSNISDTRKQQYFLIEYQSGRSTKALLETIINNFDVLVTENSQGLSIVVNNLDSVYEFDMVGYNEKLDVVIVFKELESFIYLSDLVKLPEYRDRYGDVYRNWYDSVTSSNVTVASLRRNDSKQEVITLVPSYY